MEQDTELLSSFVEEANEALGDIESDLLAVEENGANVDHDCVNKIFRGIHSMKGSAGFMGLTSIGALAHEMENVLNLIRNDELVPTPQVIEPLLKGADILNGMVEQIETSNDVDVSEQIALLKAAVNGEPVAAAAPPVEELNRDIDIALPGGDLAFVLIEEQKLVTAQREGKHIYVLDIDLVADIHLNDKLPVDFFKLAGEAGDPIDSYLSLVGLADLKSDLPDSLSFMMLYASKLEASDLADKLELSADQVHHIATPAQSDWTDNQPTEPAQTAPSVAEKSEEKAETTAAPAKSPDKPAAKAAPAAGAHKQTSLRVNVQVLDTLMNLAGELVLGRNQLVQMSGSRDFNDFESASSRIDQITSDLQEAIMQTRMQAIGSVFNKFPRIIRDLSNKLSKQCELVIEGSDVEMDKSIIEGIGDPLTHLIRNSIDHGVETPDVRTARGKTPTGTITLKAYHQAGKVNIAIVDDGNGIDGEKLKAKAVEKDIMTQEEADELSKRDAVYLIFHPGFSMAEKISDVSGRGVGMDVVKTNIDNLGGTVEIETEIGKGTTINIKLPLTLAIIPSLVVRSGKERYALPQVNINELVRIKATEVKDKVERIKDAEVLRLRGRLLPLVRLSQALSRPAAYKDLLKEELVQSERVNIADRRNRLVEARPGNDDRHNESDRRADTLAGAMNIIVVESGQTRYGLIVDELFDSKEIVVKPLGRHMKESPCLAGATILGDGLVALILDVAGIAAHQELSNTEYDHAAGDAPSINTDEMQSVLFFNNDPSETFAIPTHFIARIERIRHDQMDTVGGKEVLQYRGTSLPLISLENHVNAKPRPSQEHFNVLVYSIGEKEVGLIAPEVSDIYTISTKLDTATFKEKGIIGSVIVNDTVVRLVEVYELTYLAHPEWNASDQSAEPTSSRRSGQTRILLAEDSAFFLNQMINFLEAAGHAVTGCEDGRIAWDTLQNPDNQYDLVITDIEMPNVNGLELTRLIKSDPCLAHLPVIAVTSLAGDADRRKGYDSGVDEYQVKLDREELTQAIGRLLNEKSQKSGLGQKELPQTSGSAT
jgi:two-component system chemotaxis sensor kinase CheA